MDAISRLLVDMEQTRGQLFGARTLCDALWFNTRPLPEVTLHVESGEAANVAVTSVPAVMPTQVREFLIYRIKFY